MKENSTTVNEPFFETDHKYAIVSGWLIIPAIATVLTFLGSIIMVAFVNPAELQGFDLFIYITDVAFLPFLLIIYFAWFKRKRILPVLMIIYFIINAIWNITYLAYGYGMDTLNLLMSIIWILYFIRSKRVKATFIK